MWYSNEGDNKERKAPPPPHDQLTPHTRRATGGDDQWTRLFTSWQMPIVNSHDWPSFCFVWHANQIFKHIHANTTHTHTLVRWLIEPKLICYMNQIKAIRGKRTHEYESERKCSASRTQMRLIFKMHVKCEFQKLWRKFKWKLPFKSDFSIKCLENERKNEGIELSQRLNEFSVAHYLVEITFICKASSVKP